MTICQFSPSYNHCCKVWRHGDRHSNVSTRSSTQKEGVVLPKVHGHVKFIDPHKKPEHQPVPKPQPAPKPAPPTVRTLPNIDRSKITSIHKKPSQASIISHKLKERSIKNAQQKTRPTLILDPRNLSPPHNRTPFCWATYCCTSNSLSGFPGTTATASGPNSSYWQLTTSP